MALHKNHKGSHKGSPSPAKARKMLEHGFVKGKPITDKQKKLFGHLAGKKKK